MNRPWNAPVTNARDEEQAVAGGQHRDQVGQDEQDERADQDGPLVQPDRQRGQDRAADGEAQRVGRHQRAGRGDGDLQVGGDQVQHADHEQLGAAEHEHSEEQRGQGEVRPRRAQRRLLGAHGHLSFRIDSDCERPRKTECRHETRVVERGDAGDPGRRSGSGPGRRAPRTGRRPCAGRRRAAGCPLARVGTIRHWSVRRRTRLARNPTTACRPVNQVGIGGISSSTSARSRFTSASASARVNAST